MLKVLTLNFSFEWYYLFNYGFSKNYFRSKREIRSWKDRSVHLLRLNGYGSIQYDCSCGQNHDLNGKDVKQLATAKSFKVLLKCLNKYYTMVQLEGFLKKKAISEYGFHEDSKV